MLVHKNLKSPFSKEPFYGETPESEHLKAKEYNLSPVSELGEWMGTFWAPLEFFRVKRCEGMRLY